MTFNQFQKLKPEIAAGLPRADGPPKPAAESATGEQTPSEASASSKSKSKSGVDSISESLEKCSVTSDSSGGGSAVSATLAKVDEMIAQGLIRPFIMPDPGKPDGIRTFRKPIMTLKSVNFKYEGAEKYVVKNVSTTLTL